MNPLPSESVPADAHAAGRNALAGMRGFFTGAGLPVFILAAAGAYVLCLATIVLAPGGRGTWAGFASEFKQWCFSYDPVTGGMEWGAFWGMLAEPVFVGLIAAFLWRRSLLEWICSGTPVRHARAAGAGFLTAGAFMLVLIAAGTVSNASGGELPFPGARIRTALTPPDFGYVDQYGQPTSLESFSGDVVIVTGIYAYCSTSCPEILVELHDLLDDLPPRIRNKVRIVALSLNPEEETAALMRGVTEAYGFTYPEFRYLDGEPAGMHEALSNLGFARRKDPQTGVIQHANLFLVLDPQGRIAYRFTLDQRLRSWLREAVVSLAQEAGKA